MSRRSSFNPRPPPCVSLFNMFVHFGVKLTGDQWRNGNCRQCRSYELLPAVPGSIGQRIRGGWWTGLRHQSRVRERLRIALSHIQTDKHPRTHAIIGTIGRRRQGLLFITDTSTHCTRWEFVDDWVALLFEYEKKVFRRIQRSHIGCSVSVPLT